MSSNTIDRQLQNGQQPDGELDDLEDVFEVDL